MPRGRRKSQYVELLELRRACLQQGREDLAQELLEAAQELQAQGQVTQDQLRAGAYV